MLRLFSGSRGPLADDSPDPGEVIHVVSARLQAVSLARDPLQVATLSGRGLQQRHEAKLLSADRGSRTQTQGGSHREGVTEVVPEALFASAPPGSLSQDPGRALRAVATERGARALFGGSVASRNSSQAERGVRGDGASDDARPPLGPNGLPPTRLRAPTDARADALASVDGSILSEVSSLGASMFRSSACCSDHSHSQSAAAEAGPAAVAASVPPSPVRGQGDAGIVRHKTFHSGEIAMPCSHEASPVAEAASLAGHARSSALPGDEDMAAASSPTYQSPPRQADGSESVTQRTVWRSAHSTMGRTEVLDRAAASPLSPEPADFGPPRWRRSVRRSLVPDFDASQPLAADAASGQRSTPNRGDEAPHAVAGDAAPAAAAKGSGIRGGAKTAGAARDGLQGESRGAPGHGHGGQQAVSLRVGVAQGPRAGSDPVLLPPTAAATAAVAGLGASAGVLPPVGAGVPRQEGVSLSASEARAELMSKSRMGPASNHARPAPRSLRSGLVDASQPRTGGLHARSDRRSAVKGKANSSGSPKLEKAVRTSAADARVVLASGESAALSELRRRLAAVAEDRGQAFGLAKEAFEAAGKAAEAGRWPFSKALLQLALQGCPPSETAALEKIKGKLLLAERELAGG